jgi:class 3 adenylate cyclase/predicted ATPase
MGPSAAVSGQRERPGDGQAERRQLTVLFCDLVGYTALSEKLDPEELRRVVRAYQQVCSDEVRRNEGHVAQYLGDGVLIYFGYPVAHEDNAQRAVRTALATLAGVEGLSKELQQENGLDLSVRVGIHTGEVVVGEVGAGDARAQLAVGETPNLAARAQSVAEPNTVVITADTHHLVVPYFTFQDFGVHSLKGITRPVQLYQVMGETGAHTRMQAAATLGVTPLVGRERENQHLLECWQRAKSGNAQVVLLSGEPGIGKSRMIEELKGHLASETYSLLECFCTVYQQNTAFAPFLHLLRRAFGIQREDSPQAKLAKLRTAMEHVGLVSEEGIALIAPLVGVPPEAGYTPPDVSPLRQRQLTLETLTNWLMKSAEQSPVLCIVEDLHWADPSSLELLGLVLSGLRTHPLLVLLTFRPEFRSPWPAHEGMHDMALTGLTPEQVTALATHVAHNRTLPTAVLTEVVKRTDGVPLFVEEMTRMLLESGFLKAANGSYELSGPLPARAIPVTVQDSLMARLDRLGSAKTLAQLGATIGRDFRHDVLQAVAEEGEVALERDLGLLLDANMVTRDGLPPEVTYTFRHALIQDAAYQSLLKSTRQQYHQRIARVLAEHFPEIAETQPELLAQHFTAAGFNQQAVGYWHKAGQRAMERSANLEAINHFRKGLELLAGVPETAERVQQELMLQLSLGMPLLATTGYASPDVGAIFSRAREICLQIGGVPQLAPVLYGLWAFYLVRCESETAREIASELLALAEKAQDRDLLLEAHTVQGITDFWIDCDLSAARTHLEQAASLYDLERHYSHALTYFQDPGVASLANLTFVLWIQGYPDQALKRTHQARRLARDRGHAYSLAYSFAWEAPLRQFYRTVREAREVAEEGIAFCTQKGFPLWLVNGTIVRNWALVQQGEGEQAIAHIGQANEMWRGTGARTAQPYFHGVLADACRHLGQIEPGLRAVDEGLELVRQYRENWYEAELLRLRGELLLAQSKPDETQAEACFQQSLEVARRQGARSWELRTSLSLARLWRKQGQRDRARQVLTKAYNWFTEGFDMRDQQEARQLLAELG